MGAGASAPRGARGRRKKLKRRIEHQRNAAEAERLTAFGLEVDVPQLSVELEEALDMWLLMGRRVDLGVLPGLCSAYGVALDDELLWRLTLLQGQLGGP